MLTISRNGGYYVATSEYRARASIGILIEKPADRCIRLARLTYAMHLTRQDAFRGAIAVYYVEAATKGSIDCCSGKTKIAHQTRYSLCALGLDSAKAGNRPSCCLRVPVQPTDRA
jgi:hypothetical protein